MSKLIRGSSEKIIRTVAILKWKWWANEQIKTDSLRNATCWKSATEVGPEGAAVFQISEWCDAGKSMQAEVPVHPCQLVQHQGIACRSGIQSNCSVHPWFKYMSFYCIG